MAPVKLVPVMVTVVPPAVGPEVGETPVTVGGQDLVGELVGRHRGTGARRAWSRRCCGSAAAWAGETAVIWVEETTVKLVAATVPKSDLGGPGEVGPGDGDRGAARRRARGG